MSDQQPPQGQQQPGPAPIPLAPVPMNWAINPGEMNGQRIVLVQIATPVGTFAFIVPGDNARPIGEKFIEAGTGVQIAQQMPGQPPGHGTPMGPMGPTGPRGG